jgi:hypothetical protein
MLEGVGALRRRVPIYARHLLALAFWRSRQLAHFALARGRLRAGGRGSAIERSSAGRAPVSTGDSLESTIVDSAWPPGF